MSERLFIDTSAFYALSDTSDGRHREAQAALARITAASDEVYTTNAVLQETHALLVNRLNRDQAFWVIERLYASSAHIIRPTEGDERRALELLRREQDKEYSLVDAISMMVMRRLHLRIVWSYDHHFTQAGFTRIE